MPPTPLIAPASAPFGKICGITCAGDAALCAEAGADAIGINFFPGSKRYHPLEQARGWLGEFSGRTARVALFVNASLDEIRSTVDSALFEAVQLHGDETREFCAAAQTLGLPVIRGLALRSASDIPALSDYPADALILDAHAPGEYGGTGRLSDWHLAAEAVRRFPDKTIFLSGGLTPENVAQAFLEVRPFGIDLASGVESAPGRKDPIKVRSFLSAAKSKPDIPH